MKIVRYKPRFKLIPFIEGLLGASKCPLDGSREGISALPGCVVHLRAPVAIDS